MERVEPRTIETTFQASPSRVEKWGVRWAQAVTIAIALNLVLVFFNLTYVPLRQVYLQYSPAIVQVYDPVKGIEPSPITEAYLAKISDLRTAVAAEGLNSQTTNQILSDLREQSTTLIDENPFLASGRVTTFARLKRRIRDFTGMSSASHAFNQFWQSDYLAKMGWHRADQFIATRLEDLLFQNYYRQTLPTGQFVDDFWKIDIFFMVFFGGELLLRTFIISRRNDSIGWDAALARRWYEVPLILPFWRWLRLLPFAVRLHRTQLLNVENLIGQVTHEPAAYLADRVSKFAMVRLINQTQTSVQSGQLLNPLAASQSYTQVGDPKKVDEITDRLLQLVVLRVLPTVKPDLERLLRHSLRQSLMGADVYTGLQQLPGIATLPNDALDAIADYLAQASCDVLANSYSDYEGRLLLEQLSHDFRQSLGQQLQANSNSEELRKLVSDLLEELKINYVQRSEEDDPKATLQEVDALDQQLQP